MDISLANAIFWIAVACCLFAQIAIVRSALIAPVVSQPGEGLPRPRRAVEVLWAILPAIALGVLLYYTWRAIHLGSPSPRSVIAAHSTLRGAP